MRSVQFARRLIRKLIDLSLHDSSSIEASTCTNCLTIYHVYLKAQVQGSANAQKRVKSFRGVGKILGIYANAIHLEWNVS